MKHKQMLSLMLRHHMARLSLRELSLQQQRREIASIDPNE
jgi:hypothetical protein